MIALAFGFDFSLQSGRDRQSGCRSLEIAIAVQHCCFKYLLDVHGTACLCKHPVGGIETRHFTLWLSTFGTFGFCNRLFILSGRFRYGFLWLNLADEPGGVLDVEAFATLRCADPTAGLRIEGFDLDCRGVATRLDLVGLADLNVCCFHVRAPDFVRFYVFLLR